MARFTIWATAGLALVLASGGPPAHAQVMEILQDGSVATHQGPGVYTDEGHTALVVAVLAPPTGGQTPAGVAKAIAGAASRYQISPTLIEAVAWQESRFRQASVSPKGAIGVMQLMPATARELGVDGRDLEQNVLGGAAYLARMLQRYQGNLELALAAYNAGPGAVDRHGGVPPYAETRAYVRAVMGRMSALAAARP